MKAEANLKTGRKFTFEFTRYVAHDMFMEFYNGNELVLILWHSDSSYVDIKV